MCAKRVGRHVLHSGHYANAGVTMAHADDERWPGSMRSTDGRRRHQARGHRRVTSERSPASSTLTARKVAIDTYRENVVYLRRDCPVYRAEGFQALSKVEVRANGSTILAVLNVVDDARLVGERELGLSEEAFAQLGIAESATVHISHAEPPRSIASLKRKIAGERLSRDELAAMVRDIADHRYSKIELGGVRRRHQPDGARSRRGPAPDGSDGQCRPPARLAREAGGGQALHRRHPRQSHLDDRRADRGGARA